MFNSSLRVVVCDSQQIVCDALSRLISKQYPEARVDGVLDIADATRKARDAGADVLLLQMPNCDSGVWARLIGKIKRAGPRVRLLCILESADPAMHFNITFSGMDGCVLSGDGKQVLFDAIRALHRGQRYLSPTVRRMMTDRDRQSEAQLHAQVEVA